MNKKDETMTDSLAQNGENSVGPTFLGELQKIVLQLAQVSQNMQANGTGRDSFEVRMTARGQRVYDIKMYRQPDETIQQYMARFDELDKELDRRARTGE